MRQQSLFPEMEITRPVSEPEVPQTIEIAKEVTPMVFDKDEPVIVIQCANCTQELFVPRSYKVRAMLCDDCNEKFSHKYDKFKNYALIRALRIHKLIQR